MSRILSNTMSVSTPERVLILKMVYESHGNIVVTVSEFRCWKKLLGTMSPPRGMR